MPSLARATNFTLTTGLEDLAKEVEEAQPKLAASYRSAAKAIGKLDVVVGSGAAARELGIPGGKRVEAAIDQIWKDDRELEREERRKRSGPNGNLVNKMEELADRVDGTEGENLRKAAKTISFLAVRVKSGEEARDELGMPGVTDQVEEAINAILRGETGRGEGGKAASSVPAQNSQIAEILEQIAALEAARGQPYKASAFNTAATAIGSYTGKITSGKQARQALPGRGIGDSTMAVIDEVLATGTSSRLNGAGTPEKGKKGTLGKKGEDAAKVIAEFMRYYEVGKVAAERFYREGYRTRKDLLTKAKLTRAQRLGLEWYDQISQFIPREDIDDFRKEFESILTPLGLNWQLGGSYARGAATSGDIDLLIEIPEREGDGAAAIDMAGVILLLSDMLEVNLDSGPVFFRGIAVNRPYSNVGRRLDISLSQPGELIYAVLHSIGSGPFNRLLRQRAKDLGYTLSQHGLFKDGERIEEELRTEEDIFEFLGVKWIPPRERTKDITVLQLAEE